MIARLAPLLGNFRVVALISVLLHLALASMCLYKYQGMKSNLIEVNAEITNKLVEGYAEYYEKNSETRLEGAQTFIKIASEPNMALIVINQSLFIVFIFIGVSALSSIYYEYKLTKLRKHLASVTSDI